ICTLPRKVCMVLIPLSIIGCASDDGLAGDDPSAADNGPAACEIIDMRTIRGLEGKPLDASQFASLQDPVANRVLRGSGCPTSFGAIQMKITAEEPDCGPDKIHFGFISETTSLTATKAPFRVVVYRGEAFSKNLCSEQLPSDLLISMFGF